MKVYLCEKILGLMTLKLDLCVHQKTIMKGCFDTTLKYKFDELLEFNPYFFTYMTIIPWQPCWFL